MSHGGQVGERWRGGGGDEEEHRQEVVSSLALLRAPPWVAAVGGGSQTRCGRSREPPLCRRQDSGRVGEGVGRVCVWFCFYSWSIFNKGILLRAIAGLLLPAPGLGVGVGPAERGRPLKEEEGWVCPGGGPQAHRAGCPSGAQRNSTPQSPGPSRGKRAGFKSPLLGDRSPPPGLAGGVERLKAPPLQPLPPLLGLGKEADEGHGGAFWKVLI